MDRVILITGASSDVGLSYIAENIGEYEKVIAHYNHKSERLEELLKIYENKIVPIQADFSSMDEVKILIRKLQNENLIPTHILHLTALPFNSERFHKTDVATYQKMMQVSVYSIIEILRFCIPRMQKQKYGRILFMLSAYTTIPDPKFATPYVASKYALLGIMKAVAAEYASKGIIINGISPQMMETKFIKDVPDLIIEQHKATVPMGRLIQIEDVLPVMRLLLSDEATAITGENVGVQGGGYDL